MLETNASIATVFFYNEVQSFKNRGKKEQGCL